MLLAPLPWAFFLLAIPSEAVRHNIAAFSKMIIAAVRFHFEPQGDEQLLCLFREHIGLQQELHSLHGRGRWGNNVDIIIVVVIVVVAVLILVLVIIIIIIIQLLEYAIPLLVTKIRTPSFYNALFGWSEINQIYRHLICSPSPHIKKKYLSRWQL